MHYQTRKLHESQFITVEPVGSLEIELTLYEKGEVKLCNRLPFQSRAKRAIALAMLNDAFEIFTRTSHTTDTSLVRSAFFKVLEG